MHINLKNDLVRTSVSEQVVQLTLSVVRVEDGGVCVCVCFFFFFVTFTFIICSSEYKNMYDDD